MNLELINTIVILGSTGFVGSNLIEDLPNSGINYEIFGTSRRNSQVSSKIIYFDIEDANTWSNICEIKPNVIINAIGYGVVKNQSNISSMISVNYLNQVKLKEYLDINLESYYWIQIGTAFEYDLNSGKITEDTSLIPKTNYGISKMLFSNYLRTSKTNYIILRPFAMFGAYEDESKLIPLLINSQLNKESINLSDGTQERDYFYVKDMSSLIICLLNQNIKYFLGTAINIGSGTCVSIKTLSERISHHIKDFNPKLWQWGNLLQRDNESMKFYNESQKAFNIGFKQTNIDVALLSTIRYYSEKNGI